MNTTITLRLPTPVRWWAIAGGLVGLLASAFLILFFLTAQSWTDSPGDGSFGLVNDLLMTVQYLLLLPVIPALGRLMPGDGRVRAWTGIGFAAAVAVIVLQLLLVTEVLPFAYQVVPVSVSGVVSMCWAGVISIAAARAGVLPAAVTGLGRLILIAVPAAIASYGLGALVTGVWDVSWAWAVGAIPGVAVWALFPAWTLLLGLKK